MILIADDNPEMRQVIASMLEDLDGEIVECADGNAAIESYEKNRPEWVLIDINMRPLDGLSAMKIILERHPEAKIVIVSQHQDVRTRSTAMSLGAHAFVGKGNLLNLRALIKGEIVNHLTASES
jgi:two-component system, NarL family, nitrate/nitrite response regulator NarL